MSAYDALENSPWNDVVSANPGIITDVVTDETSSPENEQDVKNKEELLQTLTKVGNDSSFLRSPIKNTDSLFNDSTSSPLQVEVESKPPSPRRLVYKKPTGRYRRSNGTTVPNLKEDELGPLGQSLSEISLDNDSTIEIENSKTLYEEASTTPQFNINRTNLDSFEEPSTKFQISVADPVKVGDITSAHTIYTIITKIEDKQGTIETYSVTRRYTDFVHLYGLLLSKYPGHIIPTPPSKQSLGRFDDSFIELRRGQLENMLRKISGKVFIKEDDECDFFKFLKIQKWEEGVIVHDLESNESSNNNNNSSSEKGFFLNSIGGAFASLQGSGKRQYVETDEWFIEKKLYFDKMEVQLTQFSKALEMIEQLRGDLRIVLDEFVTVLTTLADLEVSKTITDIILQFIDVEVRIKELLGRLSVQDLLTLGTTLEEYERTMKSVKKVFQQREKIGAELNLVDLELKKKKALLSKATNGTTTQLEKLNILKLDLSKCEKKFDLINSRFKDITKVIKEEINIFEREKIHDFRNTVEVYLEGLVEAQKESVELWETFYEKL